jgi:NADH-quinone oxidoreductase subunit G
MPKLIIDGKEIIVDAGLTVLQACELAGAEIPRFCYHDRLSIAGNCRMCLVEMEKSPKPIASCAMPAADNMVIHTNTPQVKKAREGVMEFLLINHPLDCPVCDQGGECDLQDQAFTYGRGTNRYDENKRSVKDKYMGPLIKTHMNRCIHCTRCIRFITEVAGIEELGALGRGEHMEVTTYVEKALTSEVSGNIIDLCPVGALTSKPYAFKARNWELKKTETIDVLDGVGSNIRVDSRGMEVMRILPRINEDINEEWISDKTRFAYDGLKNQRLDRPMIKKDGKLTTVSWEEALNYIVERMKNISGDKFAAFAGDLVDCESMVILKDILNSLNCYNHESRLDNAKIEASKRVSYLFNTTISGIEQSDLCLIIGANPRYDATMVNTRIRKRWLIGNYPVINIGPKLDLTYKVTELGDDTNILKQILDGNHPLCEQLTRAEFPMLIIGADVVMRADGAEILNLIHKLCEKYNLVKDGWNGYNLLNKTAAKIGALDLGFVSRMGVETIYKLVSTKEIEVVYLLGADEIDMDKIKGSFIIYQGHHGDKGAHAADVILPGAAYTEKNATYVNIEGRIQQTLRAVSPPGDAKEDHAILLKLAEHLQINLPYKTLSQIRKRMSEIAPHFVNPEELHKANWCEFGNAGQITDNKIILNLGNYYMSDPITRASKIMADCSKVIYEKAS